MRMIIGLDRPDSGQITIDGKRYAEHRAPIHEVGALLDAKAVHPAQVGAQSPARRSAPPPGCRPSGSTRCWTSSACSGAAGRKAGDFSLGMSQRLGIAGALLADPQILLFDEPVNGLDPEGILWIRGLLGELAAQGRTVFVSSHLITELGAVAEHLVIIGRGKLIAEIPMSELGAGAAQRPCTSAPRRPASSPSSCAAMASPSGRGRPRGHRDHRAGLAGHRPAGRRGRRSCCTS